MRDGTHNSPKYQREGYPLVTSKNLVTNGIDLSEVSFISKYDYQEINKRSKVETGDILFGMIGTIGNPVMVKKGGFAIKNVALIKHGGEVSNGFLLYLLKSSTFLQYIRKENAGGTQKFLGLSVIRSFKFKVPDKVEQGKIASIFNILNRLITLQQRKLELLKEIKKGLLQKMFADKSKFPILRFEGFHAEWEQRKLGEVIELEDNKRKPVKASKRIPGNIPYYGANGIQDYVKGYTHTGEHVLVAEDGANSISNYPVYFICSPSWINNHSHVLTGKGSIISNKFLTYNLKTVPYAKYLVGSGRYKLNAETLKIIPIKLPLLTEQNYIGSTLSKIDKLITLQHQRLSKLNEIKKSLLQQMFI